MSTTSARFIVYYVLLNGKKLHNVDISTTYRRATCSGTDILQRRLVFYFGVQCGGHVPQSSCGLHAEPGVLHCISVRYLCSLYAPSPQPLSFLPLPAT